jgi:hypothetical protein
VDREWWERLRSFERYRVRVHAAALRLADPIFALDSAAAVHGLPVFGDPVIHLFAPSAKRGYRHGDDVTHASADSREIVHVGGVRATSLRDTTLDLLRVLPFGPAVATLDAALRAGLDLEEMRIMLEVQANRRGRVGAARALEAGDARAESVLESLSRVLFVGLGYPAPELQVAFRLGNTTARTDFFWRKHGVVGEADGNLKYVGAEVRTDEVIRAERRREVALLRVVRRVARWEWADVVDPRRLDRILAGAGIPRERLPVLNPTALLSNRRTRL